ncbi:hypothetical protein EGW08_021948 [Elysia chlorotica]|uniref:Uncharacterized protein n=1 Tax=Elysia chlorotica TaxID=188477 RepID=A0A3S0ZLN5_ELYCH|nr:hypothetical protein EGW08_021948 [Elysia chlorotica]
MNLNNPISIFANDVKPLRPSIQGVDGLDDKLNTQTFISDEIIRVTEEGGIGYANVSHNLEVMYAMKLICGTYSLLSSMPFGLISQYMYCDDRIHQNFVVSNMYHIDASDGHQELIPGRVEVTNRVIVVRRSVRTGLPLVGSFSVQKDLRSEVCTALKAFCEELKTNRMERLALGLAETNEYDNPKLLILRNMIANFFANVKLNVKFCSSGQVRGTNAKILRRLIQYSPSVYSLMRVKPHKQVTLKAADLAVTLNSSVADLAFGLNKPIPYTYYGSADAGAEQKEALIKLLNLYDQYTDNDGALDDMHGYLTGPGAPFNKPTAVVITTGRVIDMLCHVGVVKTTTCTVVQKIAEISLSSADMSPMVTAAPQKAVNLVNGQYTFDPSGQIKRKEISTEDQTVLYSKLGNHNLMFCAVEPSLFTNNILREAQMESMTTFDSIIPTGVILCEGDCTEIPKGPSQQVTHFCNEFSTQYTLKCSSMAGILRALFVDGGKAFFSFKQGIDDIEDSSAYEKSMVFYRYRGELYNADGTPAPSQFQAESGDGSETREGLDFGAERINVPDNESTGVKIVEGAVVDNANETGGGDRDEAGGSGENDAVEPGAEEAGVRATGPTLDEAVTAQNEDRVKDNYSVLKTTISINKYMVDNYYYSHAVHVKYHVYRARIIPFGQHSIASSQGMTYNTMVMGMVGKNISANSFIVMISRVSSADKLKLYMKDGGAPNISPLSADIVQTTRKLHVLSHLKRTGYL